SNGHDLTRLAQSKLMRGKRSLIIHAQIVHRDRTAAGSVGTDPHARAGPGAHPALLREHGRGIARTVGAPVLRGGECADGANFAAGERVVPGARLLPRSRARTHDALHVDGGRVRWLGGYAKFHAAGADDHAGVAEEYTSRDRVFVAPRA